MDNPISNSPMPLNAMRLNLAALSESGCDRIPVKVRNLAVPFFLAGIDASHVFLANAETCMVTRFNLDELESLTLGQFEEIQELVFAWMDSVEGEASRSLIESARMADDAGTAVPVLLRWPGSSNSRHGFLTIGSAALGGTGTIWICGVETVADNNVVFRYGVTRLERAMHDGKRLIMTLKPGTSF